MKKKAFLASIITLIILVVSCGILAIPGQFAHMGAEQFSGYEIIFHYCVHDGFNYLGKNTPNATASVAGIIALVMILFALICLVFNRKSTVLPLLGGICSAIAGLLFISMNLWIAVLYYGHSYAMVLNWATYVIGSLLIVAGGALIAVGIFLLKEDGAQLAAPKSQQYNYLKSNKKED